MTGHLELGGLALGLVPIVPEIGLPPDLVLLIFLPPLLYSAAFFSSPRDLKANLRPIASLSIGLVLLTTPRGRLGGAPGGGPSVGGVRLGVHRLADRPGGGDGHRG